MVCGKSAKSPERETKPLKDYHRLEMVRLAVEEDDRFRASDIEFKLPTPSYTIDTLTYLEEKHPGKEFQLVMGADGLRTFHKWKHADLIVEKYHRLIYPRPGELVDASARFAKCHPGKCPIDGNLFQLYSKCHQGWERYATPGTGQSLPVHARNAFLRALTRIDVKR